MVKAVILVRVDPKVRIAEKVKGIEGVKDAFDVAGRFDAVIIAEVMEFADLKKLALKIQEVEGVRRTETLIHLE